MKRKPILPILALLGVAAILFVTLVLPPLRNASIAKTVRRNLVARGYGDVESSLKDQHVYLWGRSKTAEERAAVENIARNTPGVAGVSNYTGIEDDLTDAIATSDSLRTELGDTLARLEETGGKLDAMSQRAANLDSDLTATRMSLAQTKASLAETQTALTETQTNLKETRTALEQRTEDLAAFKVAWSRDKAELEVALASQKSAHEKLRETLANTEILLAEARRVLATRDREYARESGELKKTLADLGAKLKATESGLNESEQSKMTAGQRAIQLKAELDAAAARMAALAAKREDTEKLLTEARRVIAVRDQEFVAQSEKLAATESALAALKEQLEQKPDETPAPQLQAYPRPSFNSF